DTRVSGSLEIVLRYQLKSALPSSPREFLGCGVWFMSTLATGPTMRTERPRYGGGGGWGARRSGPQRPPFPGDRAFPPLGSTARGEGPDRPPPGLLPCTPGP